MIEDDPSRLPRTAPPVSGAQLGPSVFDALLGLTVTVVVSLFIAADIGDGTADGWAYLWAVGLGGLMLVRRRYPVFVVVVSAVAVIAYHMVGYPPIGIAVPLAAAVFSAAESGRVLAASLASLSVVVISVAYRLAVGQDPAFVLAYELPGTAVLLGGAIAFGDSVRSRRELRLRSEEIAGLVRERMTRESEQRLLGERLGIARELHDSVGHALTVVNLNTQLLEEALKDYDDPAVERSLAAIAQTTSATFAELRRTVASLRNEAESRTPLRLADLAAATRPAEQSGLEVRTRVRLRSAPPASVEAAVYRIVQEAITNVVRHADASRVEVVVAENDREVSVMINDNGRDHPDHVEPGAGIAGMAERTELLGGTFSARSTDHGFTVRATFPREVTA